MTIKNHTTGLRPWKCNSSVSYTNLCAIYSITITDNWYMRHLPFQGKVKTGLRPTSREGEQGEVGELFFIVFYSV